MYKINVTTICFKDYEKTPDDFLNQFNFLILGGCDAVCYLKDKYFSQKSSQKIVNFYSMKNGVILLLHDICYFQCLSPLYKLLGVTGNSKKGFITEVSFNTECEKLDIITSPFVVGTSFEISETHQCTELNSKCTVLSSSNGESVGDHYYSENLKENIAECSMSHTSSLTVPEKKFICNAVCHLFNHYQASMKLINK